MKRFRGVAAVGLSLVFALTMLVQDARCDVVGNTYSIAGTVFNSGGGGFFAHTPAGPQTFTFDGTSKAIGALAFGNMGDQLFIEETQTLAADGITFTVDVNLVARDATGALTTWAAAGTVFDNDGDPATPDVPFDLAFFNLATVNGGTDTLEVNQAGFNYTFVSSEALLFTVGGPLFTFGSGPTDPAGPSGLFSATVGANVGDISLPSAALAGEALAGYGFTWTYTLTAIPEPGSFGLVSLVAMGLIARRRRS